MNPQYYEPVMERLFAAGAMDVWLDPIIMKKDVRPLGFAVLFLLLLKKKLRKSS